MIERRNLTITDDPELETRSEVTADGKRSIMGYFAVNNSNSVLITERDKKTGQLRTFTERINPTAFSEADLSNVVYTVEHSMSRPIARTGANLKVQVTDKGLFARAEIPNEQEATTEQNDLIKYVNQKIIRSNSFAFVVPENGDEWYRQNGLLFRTINKIDRVVDITSTIAPAYPDTYVFSRSLDEDSIKDLDSVEHERTENANTDNVAISETVVNEEQNELEKINMDFEFLKLKAKQF